eukprot:m51a1_g2934 putative lupus la protein (417) ;mRNA; f:583815-585540
MADAAAPAATTPAAAPAPAEAAPAPAAAAAAAPAASPASSPAPAAPAAAAPAATTTTTPAAPAAPLTADEKDILMQKIRTQIEFYFSDSNLPGDKFLRGLVEAEAGGWVAVSVVASFNRVKGLTTDLEIVKEALRTSDSVEIEGERIRRRAPLSAADQAVIDSRTIYAKGWPKEPEPTIEGVTQWWSKFGRVLSVRLRRYTGSFKKGGVAHGFKGTLLVEFETPKLAKSVLEQKPEGPAGPFAEWCLKSEWAAKEVTIAAERAAARNAKKPVKREDSPAEGEGESRKRSREIVIEEGAVLRLTGLAEVGNARDLRDELNKAGEVNFVEAHWKWPADAADAVVVRCPSAEAAKKVAEHIAANGVSGKTGITAAAITGDELKAYTDAWMQQNEERPAKRGRGRGRGGRGGRGRGRGRH